MGSIPRLLLENTEHFINRNFYFYIFFNALWHLSLICLTAAPAIESLHPHRRCIPTCQLDIGRLRTNCRLTGHPVYNMIEPRNNINITQKPETKVLRWDGLPLFNRQRSVILVVTGGMKMTCTIDVARALACTDRHSPHHLLACDKLSDIATGCAD